MCTNKATDWTGALDGHFIWNKIWCRQFVVCCQLDLIPYKYAEICLYSYCHVVFFVCLSLMSLSHHENKIPVETEYFESRYQIPTQTTSVYKPLVQLYAKVWHPLINMVGYGEKNTLQQTFIVVLYVLNKNENIMGCAKVQAAYIVSTGTYSWNPFCSQFKDSNSCTWGFLIPSNGF